MGESIRKSILLDDGDVIKVGAYRFRCVQTPGHTRGHTCLYEPALKYLVAGDHILSEITPTIQLWSETENPLGAYLDSLDKIARLDVELVLPGHRGLITNCEGRIRELKDHCRSRLDDILTILRHGSLNAYQVAMRMSWDVEYTSWEQFPLSQRWFATGEAISHLRYLEEKHDICRNIQNGKIFFALVSASPGFNSFFDTTNQFRQRDPG